MKAQDEFDEVHTAERYKFNDSQSWVTFHQRGVKKNPQVSNGVELGNDGCKR